MQLYGDALTLQEVRDSGFGKRPSFRKLLDLIDTSDPAWPLTAAVLREMTAAGAGQACARRAGQSDYTRLV